jgi:magnesium-transporting ATPase (P-type)
MFEYSFAAHELEIIAFLSFCFFLLVYQIYRYFSHAGEVYDAFKQNKVKAFNFIRTNVFITTILIAFSVTCIFCVSYYLIFLSSNAVTIYDFDFRIGKYPLFYSAHFCFILHFVSFLFFLGYKENSYINVIENALIFDNYVDVDKHDESEDAYIFSDEEKNKAIESKIAQATILRKESKTQPIANKIPASKVQVSTTKKITKPVVKIKGGKK